jgi:hypothetical protein
LTLSWLYVNARLECRRHGWSMIWKNTRMLELMKLGIEPDAFLAVIQGDKKRAAFVEYTGVLPTASEMERKVAGYDAFLQARQCQHHLGVESITIMWLTTSCAKAAKLGHYLKRSSYPDYFLIGSIDESDQFLTSAIWQWTESTRRISWVKPPQHTAETC